MEWMKKRQEEMIELLEQLVNTDSGSTDKEGIDRVGDILKGHYEALGFVAETIENEKNGNHLLFRQPDATEPKLLLIGHMDTVFAKGTAAKRPFRIEDGRAYGPGVVDMKGSQVTLLFALKFLAEHDPGALRNVTILLNSDEEIGSPTSRELIEETARPVDYALVVEPARKDGSLVSSRRGGGHYEMHVTGRAAHSGGAPEEGISAIEELAHKIIKLNGLSDHANGVSVSVGIIDGGEAINMIPDRATASIDVRINTEQQSHEIHERIEAICAEADVPGTTIRLEGGINRPPMEFGDKNRALLERVKSIGESFGLNVTHIHAGGGSDASFPSALGVATIDGLGPVGGELHNVDEYLELDSLAERCYLLAETVRELSK